MLKDESVCFFEMINSQHQPERGLKFAEGKRKLIIQAKKIEICPLVFKLILFLGLHFLSYTFQMTLCLPVIGMHT